MALRSTGETTWPRQDQPGGSLRLRRTPGTGRSPPRARSSRVWCAWAGSRSWPDATTLMTARSSSSS